MTFQENNLADLCEIVSSKRVFAASYQSEGIPFYRGKEISQLARGEKTTAELYISKEVYRDVISRTGPINPGDILLTAVGTLGNPYLVKESNLPFYFKDGNIVWLRNYSELIDANFLFYWLNSEYGRRKVLDTAIGSTQAALTISGLGEIEISFPSRSQQDGIVNILSAIDEKISVNNALSKTLEDIAQTIFKSWFVDFDPVKAKMAGEKPAGMDAATVALFPDSMEESELGLIPKGWKVSNLKYLSFVRYGAPFASKLFNTTKVGLPLIRIRDLKKQSISTWSPENHTKGFLVSGGELLVGMDGEFNPTIWFGADALVNQRICKIEPKDFVSNFFLYFTLLPIMRRIEHGSTGSTVIHLGKTDIDAIKVCEPSQKILAEYKSMVEPMLRQMVSLNIQTRILQEARDALLPRLISGELQIPEEMLAS